MIPSDLTVNGSGVQRKRLKNIFKLIIHLLAANSLYYTIQSVFTRINQKGDTLRSLWDQGDQWEGRVTMTQVGDLLY